MVHKTVATMTEVARPHLGDLPTWRLFDANEASGHVLVFPPGTKPNLPNCRYAMASGWAIDPSAKYRYGVDVVRVGILGRRPLEEGEAARIDGRIGECSQCPVADLA